MLVKVVICVHIPTVLITNRAKQGKGRHESGTSPQAHDYVIKSKHFPCNWPFVWGIHRSPVNSSLKGQWREALMFSLICAWINGWVKNWDTGDLRRHGAHYDVTVMQYSELAFVSRSLNYLSRIHVKTNFLIIDQIILRWRHVSVKASFHQPLASMFKHLSWLTTKI